MVKMRIVHVEDDPNDWFFVRRTLEQSGFDADVVRAATREEFLTAISDGKPDAILFDQGLPGFGGGAALELAREMCPRTPLIVVSGAFDPRKAAASIKAGATDYVLKDQLWQLPAAIRRAQAGIANEDARQLLEKQRLRLEQDSQNLASQLEAVRRELDDFSYSVSHDLRGPLRTIDGYAQILGDELPRVPSEYPQLYLACIKSEVQRMSGMIDGLLGLCRIGRGEMNFEKTDLSLIAGELLARLQREHPDRRVEVRIRPGLSARGDTPLLVTMLEALFSNAWKFTMKQSEAVIEFESAAQSDGSKAFFVRDNGVGFDPRYAGHLFSPFQRLHWTEEYAGSGMGLAIAQRIVHRHGGRIWADAQEGKGATFFFTLP